MNSNNLQLTVAGNYTPTITGNGTLLTLSLEANLSLKSKDKYVLIALDTSGSMHGDPIRNSKVAISELIKTLFKHTKSPNIGLITFDSDPTFYSLTDKTQQKCLDVISEIDANGGTCFIPVFEMIEDIINNKRPGDHAPSMKVSKKVKIEDKPKKDIKEIAVVLLSDGQAERLDELTPYINKLRLAAQKKLASAEFHTLGFGSGHDARLLEEVTKAMPTQGTFQYVRDSDEIDVCIDAISSCLLEKRLTSSVIWQGAAGPVDKKINFTSNSINMDLEEKQSAWEGVVCLEMPIAEFERVKGTLKLSVKSEESTKVLEVPMTYTELTDKAIEIGQNCLYINEQLKKLSDAIISGTFRAHEAELIRQEVANYRVMLNELVRGVFKVKIDQRQRAIDNIKNLNDYMDQIGELLRDSANNGLTNHQIASVNALAYRQVTNKGRLRTLDKRTLNNVDLLNQVDTKTQEIAKTIDEIDFATKYKDLIEEVGCCALTLSNIPEALKAGDCLCITFDIGRPEVAIQDASRIIVKKIYPTIICASAFLDSVKHSMKLDPNNSGGFDASFEGNIVKGASNESITACLPLYLCSEHWQCASEYMKPILGWNVTIDPLGYDYNQVRTVPFLLLIKALNDKTENPNEFNQRVARWLLETCCMIIKDEIQHNPKSNIAETTRQIWEIYELNGTVREVESVQNSNVFLAYVYCLQEMGVIKTNNQDEFLNKVKYMIEEEMRRRQEKGSIWNVNQTLKVSKKILKLDTKHYTGLLKAEQASDDLLEDSDSKQIKYSEEDFKEKEKKYEAFFKQARATQSKKSYLTASLQIKAKNEQKRKNREEIKEQEDPNKVIFTVPQDFLTQFSSTGFDVNQAFPEKISQLEADQKNYATQTLDHYKYCIRFLKPWLKIWGYEVPKIEKLKSVGIIHMPQLFTLFIQNKLHYKNSDRVASFINSEYRDPFDEKQAEDFMFKLAAQVSYNSWVKELNSKPKKMSHNIEDIQFFAETNSMRAAAGMLLSKSIFDLGSFEHLQQILRRSPMTCQKVLEKMQMLKHREYKDVSLNLDFKVRKKFLRQLFSKYKDEYDYDTWRELWYKKKLQAKK